MFHCQSNPKTTGNYPSLAIFYFFISLVDAGTGVKLGNSALFPPPKIVVNLGLFLPPKIVSRQIFIIAEPGI